MTQLTDIYRDIIIVQQQTYIHLLKCNLRNIKILNKLDRMIQETS